MQANGQRQYGTKYLRCLYAADLYKINTNFMPGEPFAVDVAIMGGKIPLDRNSGCYAAFAVY